MNKYKCDLPIAAIDTLKSESYMLSFDTGHIWSILKQSYHVYEYFCWYRDQFECQKEIILIQKSCKNMS